MTFDIHILPFKQLAVLLFVIATHLIKRDYLYVSVAFSTMRQISFHLLYHTFPVTKPSKSIYRNNLKRQDSHLCPITPFKGMICGGNIPYLSFAESKISSLWNIVALYSEFTGSQPTSFVLEYGKFYEILPYLSLGYLSPFFWRILWRKVPLKPFLM
ncbi:hypothetical protein VMF7928_01766 [Vibrio marisflavi CECT 7928]|uniref:Uncharacterized protein n=1 Tax=Vibrio marisflavi CECT 7928 TaxID=634439 RepID=A0ABM9A329_9VIBR|nr:hypothetical protein VMF7928_01766 [Vibrio marisflavi CECT 7928]